MTPTPNRPVDSDAILRRVDTHAKVTAELLAEPGTDRDDPAFIADLQAAARNAAEHELAELAYDLARACVAAHDEFCRKGVWVEVPRHVLDLHRAIHSLRSRFDTDLQQVSLPQPSMEADLEPILRALDVCEQFEGPSDRVRYLRAVIPGIRGQWTEVARLAQDLADSAATGAWRRMARLLVVHARSESNQRAEALAELEALAEDDGDDPMVCFDLCGLHAALGDTHAFSDAAARLRQSVAECDNETEWAQFIRNHVTRFSDWLRVDRAYVEAALGLEPAS